MNIPTVTQLNAKGLELYRQGRFSEALLAFRQVRKLAPWEASPIQNEAMCLHQLGRNREAIKVLHLGIAVLPESPVLPSVLGKVLLQLGILDQAAAHLRRAAELEPQSVAAKLLLTQALIAEGKLPEAEETAREVIGMTQASGPGFELLGTALKQSGRFVEASASFSKAIELIPGQKSLLLDYALCRKMTAEDAEFLDRLERESGRSLGPDDRVSVEFALGKFYDDVGEYGNAIQHFDLAHETAWSEIARKGSAYDAALNHRRFTEIIHRNPEGRFLSSVRNASNSCRPALIVGMVRSGTTLVEQILSRHTEVGSGGELTYWSQNWRALYESPATEVAERVERLAAEYESVLDAIDPVAQRVTDKMPGNFIALGSILSVFPKTKIIYCRRDPLDNGVSIFTTPFRSAHTWIHRREDILSYYRDHQMLMDHWRRVLPRTTFHEVVYEELVENFETTARGMIDFLGLQWDDACLSPQLANRAVSTPSNWQVRQPVYGSSVGRWRHYEPWLGALRDLRDPEQA